MTRDNVYCSAGDGLVNRAISAERQAELGPEAVPVLRTECGARLVVTYCATSRSLLCYCADCGGVSYAISLGDESRIAVPYDAVLAEDEVAEIVARSEGHDA